MVALMLTVMSVVCADKCIIPNLIRTICPVELPQSTLLYTYAFQFCPPAWLKITRFWEKLTN